MGHLLWGLSYEYKMFANFPGLYPLGTSGQRHLCPRCDNQNYLQDSAGDPVVDSPPSSAGDMGLIPGGGTNIPQATGLLSP